MSITIKANKLKGLVIKVDALYVQDSSPLMYTNDINAAQIYMTDGEVLEVVNAIPGKHCITVYRLSALSK